MRLASFSVAGDTAVRAGIITDDGLIDIAEHAPGMPGQVLALLAAGDEAMTVLTDLEQAGPPLLALEDLHLHAPIPRPGKCLGIGMNYADHAKEVGVETPRWPTVFTKQITCISGPFDPVIIPRVSDQVDYEGELVLVIGRHCRHLDRDGAARAIAGYCVGNDVSTRDWQLRTGQFTMGKSFDSHGPFGPWLTTADVVADPHNLPIRTWVNDELRQDSSTAELIFDCYDIVAHLSAGMTLEPGDVIFTGTPAGVGGFSKPPRFLKAGDRVRIEIEGLGMLDQAVVADMDL